MSGDLPTTPGHGGRRVGAGRKPAVLEEASRDAYSDYKRAQAKREAHRAVLAELEVNEKQGKLIPVEQVRADADRAARIVRDTLLAFPDRVSALLIGQDERRMAATLRAEIRSALQRISDAIEGK
jgi:phage terminase Nu1 subunit (DNA packaging protein)